MRDESDVVVLGMGPGGEDVAGRLAEAGLDVVGIDAELVGGECPYWACIPTKMMLRSANLLAEARRIPGMAGDAHVHPDWSPVAERIRAEATDDWDDTVAVDRFTGKGGRFARGFGRLVARDVVAVGGDEYRARRGVVVATGTRPIIPPIGLDDTPYWTNRDAVSAKEPPRSLVVLGAGPVGLELAQAYARFGTTVTVIEAADRILPREEPETSSVMRDALAAEGLELITGARAEHAAYESGRFRVELTGGATLEAERLLVAVGRCADLPAIGADAAGLDAAAQWISVDDHLRAAPGIWAVGDVTGVGPFTHVAVYQARIAAADILGEPTEPARYHALPRATFTDPEIGSVGLTEAAARGQGIDVRVGIAAVPSTARGWLHKAGNEGVIKLVADAERGVLVGATSVGPHGGEVLGLLTLAVHAETPLATLRSMIYAYPTFHRGVEDALRALD